MITKCVEHAPWKLLRNRNKRVGNFYKIFFSLRKIKVSCAISDFESTSGRKCTSAKMLRICNEIWQRMIQCKLFPMIKLTVVFSERELTFTFAICYRPSICRLSSVVCLSVTLVRLTQAVQIFGNISKALGTLAIHWHPLKISRRSSQGSPPPGELNTRGVAKYNDFGPIDGYISETVQARR